MTDLLKEIQAQIAGAKTAAAKQNVGVIREVGDGVARIEGLSDAMLNEMIDFGNGVTGLALNLDETEVGVVILGDYTQLKEGDEARTTGKVLQVPVGKGLLGRVVNLLGEPIDGKGPIKSDKSYPLEKTAPGIIRRRSVSQPVQTGIMPIDAMIPIGRGQRDIGCSTASTSRSARSSPPSRGLSRISNKPARCRTRSLLRPPPRTPPRTSISRHSQAQPWASGSWTTAWTR
jgi:F-type H+-transporting ATPase subunit alpha